MDKFLAGYKKKSSSTGNENSDVGTISKSKRNKEQEGSTAKKRKYDPSYLCFGFTSVINAEVEKPMCLLCSKVLAADSMRPGKLKRHLKTTHSDYVDKPKEFFQRKLDEFTKQKQMLKEVIQKQMLKEVIHSPSNALLASYLVSYKIAKCKKPHTVAETLVLPAAIDMVKVMFGESYAKKLRQIPLSDNTVSRRINDISEDICDQLLSRVRTSKFAIQVDEATDVIEDILFCKPIPEKATANEIFNIIDVFF